MQGKSILLDIDNTLYDYEPTHQKALSTTLEELARVYSIDKVVLNDHYLQARTQIAKELVDTAAAHNRLLYFQRMLELLGINPLKHSLKAYTLYWNTYIDNIVAFEDVYSFLDLVRDRDICLLTDLTAYVQYRKIEKLDLFKYVDYVVTSEEAGKDKPHPHMFDLALSKLGKTQSQVVMIGDNYERDILGASKLGIKSYWLNAGKAESDLDDLIIQFKTFKELMRYFQ